MTHTMCAEFICRGAGTLQQVRKNGAETEEMGEWKYPRMFALFTLPECPEATG